MKKFCRGLRIVPPNTILQVCIGGSIGKTAIVDSECSFNQQINSLTVHDGINTLYAFYVLISGFFKQQIMDKSTGTATPIINRSNWENLLIPIPPNVEQQQIIDKLAELLPIVEKYNKSQYKLDELNVSVKEQLQKSILQEAIQGKLVPQIAEEGIAEELLADIRREKELLVKEGKLKKSALTDSVIFKGDDNRYWEKIGNEMHCIDDEIPFDIPDSWQWIRLNNIVDIIGGYAFQGSSLKGNKGIRVIRISDISENGFVNTKIVRYTGVPISDTYRIHQFDILIAMTGGTVGKSLFVRELPEDVLLLNQRVAIVRNLWIDVEYLDLVIKAPHIKNIINTQKNSTNDNISMTDICNFLVPVPPIQEQSRIVRKLNCLAGIMSRQIVKWLK